MWRTIRAWTTTILCSTALVAALLVNRSAAAPSEWRVGTALRQELDSEFLATWSGVPLRSLLSNVAKQRRVAIWLDRRVDPGRTIDFSPRDLTLRETLDQLAHQTLCYASLVGPVVYFGPVRSCENLATLAAIKRAEVQRVPRPRGAKLLAEKAWSWPERTEPRTLVEQLLDEAGVTARNLPETVPHDLWPAQELPPLAWADRLTLVLAGFGLTYEFASDGSTVTFLPWPDEAVYEYTYAVKGDAAKAVDQLRSRYPRSELRAASGRVTVKGRFEDHEEIARALRGEKVVRTTKVGAGQRTFDINIQNQPLGPVAKTLAQRLGSEIEISPALQQDLDRLISLDVKMATAEDLWLAIGKAAGISVKVQGQKVVLEPIEK